MALAEFLSELDQLAREAIAAFDAAAGAADPAALEAARVKYLGARSGRLKALQKELAQLDKTEKPAAGKRFNEVKQQLVATLSAARRPIDAVASVHTAHLGWRIPAVTAHFVIADPTVPGVRPRLGHLHPITQTAEELKDIMGRLGFTVAEGPEVEDRWHNFEALNIPPDHPARDPLDNFYLAAAKRAAGGGSDEEGWLLRSQTSTVQIRVMEKTRPPVRVISVGRVYRPDTADATHYPMFHQIEGLLVDRHVTMADLKSILRLFAASFFQGDVHIRFRPSFFPFTEPSVEVDMSWQGGWIEIAGAGMVDPNVLQAVGYDPEEVTGFAFGLGIERVAMLKYGIDDIRLFFDNDLRFLRQF
jgi:phenylalanyl-tRNA synthetase alpha chain